MIIYLSYLSKTHWVLIFCPLRKSGKKIQNKNQEKKLEKNIEKEYGLKNQVFPQCVYYLITISYYSLILSDLFSPHFAS